MWLLPLMPISGRTASAARPPAALIALTASRQPLRRASPLTVCLAPTLLSPHRESTGTLAKYAAASLSVKPSQPPSTVTSARTRFGRLRTRSRPYTPDCEWTMTAEAPMRSSSAASAFTVLAPIPASEVSAFGTSCIVYCSIASTGNCSPGNRSEEHTSELQSQSNLVCRLLLEKKKRIIIDVLTRKCKSCLYTTHTP